MWQDFVQGNWKTTVAGILGATITIVISYLKGEMDARTFLIAFVMAVLGFLSKDATTTGTKANPRPPAPPAP